MSTVIAPTESAKVSVYQHEVDVEHKLFELAQRKASVYAQSTLVPREYQKNIGNVLIAENMAKRMGADTLMVMQNLYVVNGRPGWSAQFLVACFNSCGRFSAIKYRFSGTPGEDDYGCVAYCTELSTGEKLEGTKITWAMAKGEGWVSKAGSKWKTMPEQMFRYRAATFFVRSTAPEIGMGLLTKEELEDMPERNHLTGDNANQSQLDALTDRLLSTDTETDPPEENEVASIVSEFEAIAANLNSEPDVRKAYSAAMQGYQDDAAIIGQLTEITERRIEQINAARRGNGKQKGLLDVE